MINGLYSFIYIRTRSWINLHKIWIDRGWGIYKTNASHVKLLARTITYTFYLATLTFYSFSLAMCAKIYIFYLVSQYLNKIKCCLIKKLPSTNMIENFAPLTWERSARIVPRGKRVKNLFLIFNHVTISDKYIDVVGFSLNSSLM